MSIKLWVLFQFLHILILYPWSNLYAVKPFAYILDVTPCTLVDKYQHFRGSATFISEGWAVCGIQKQGLGCQETSGNTSSFFFSQQRALHRPTSLPTSLHSPSPGPLLPTLHTSSSCMVWSPTLKMEAASSSKMLVPIYHSTWPHPRRLIWIIILLFRNEKDNLRVYSVWTTLSFIYPILQDMQITFKILYLTFFESCKIHLVYWAL